MFRFCKEESQRKHRASVVTCTKFVFSLKLSRAAVKMASFLSYKKFPAGYVSFSWNPEGTNNHSWRIWCNGTNGVRPSNIKYQFLYEDTSAVFSSHCPLYVCVLGGQRLSQCSRNGGPHAHILRYSVPLSLFEVSLWSCPCVLTELGLPGEQTL